MGFNPELFKALSEKDTRIFRADDEKPFKVIGAPDNIGMQNIQLEFKVQRFEEK